MVLARGGSGALRAALDALAAGTQAPEYRLDEEPAKAEGGGEEDDDAGGDGEGGGGGGDDEEEDEDEGGDEKAQAKGKGPGTANSKA